MDYTYDTLKETLQNNVVSVKFTKKNGDERDMLCTLMADKLPPVVESSTGSSKAENKEVLAVFDLEAEGWRSFRLDSLKNVVVGG